MRGEDINRKQIEKLHKLAMDKAELAILARRRGETGKFEELIKSAFAYEKKAAIELFDKQLEPSRPCYSEVLVISH